jgi:RNA polymerase sigma-70 factor, ECF subfamily
LVVHRRMPEPDGLRKPEAWLRAIAVRVVHEHYRWRRIRSVRAWLIEHSWAARSVEERTPERAAVAHETLAHVRRVLQRMSTKLRDTLVLVEFEDLDLREAAELLGIPVNTVRSRRGLARAEFRRLWKQIDGAKAAGVHDDE